MFTNNVITFFCLHHFWSVNHWALLRLLCYCTDPSWQNLFAWLHFADSDSSNCVCSA